MLTVNADHCKQSTALADSYQVRRPDRFSEQLQLRVIQNNLQRNTAEHSSRDDIQNYA